MPQLPDSLISPILALGCALGSHCPALVHNPVHGILHDRKRTHRGTASRPCKVWMREDLQVGTDHDQRDFSVGVQWRELTQIWRVDYLHQTLLSFALPQ